MKRQNVISKNVVTIINMSLLCNWNIRSRRTKERERERTERGKNLK